MTRVLAADAVLAGSRWLAPGWLSVDERGVIVEVAQGEPKASDCVRLRGYLLPGFVNLHSHAFQRAIAGLTERAAGGRDSFWSWRDLMYRFVARLTPDDVEAITTMLYMEMLRAGYTSVAEFHYLHHGPEGTPYDDPAELSERVLNAAQSSGIRVTLLPVLYMVSGFGETKPAREQRRFCHDLDGYVRLWETLASRHPELTLGVAPHSLRAVPAAELRSCIEHFSRVAPAAPVHLHISEQLGEVEQCQAAYSARPVEWLLANFEIDQRYCLVHATHANEGELVGIARSGAVAGLCPTTEANLGDGLFNLASFGASNGLFGVGSDSQVSLNPIEELRWLEYGQRLQLKARNVASDAGEPSTGDWLFQRAGAGGARALGQPVGEIAPGRQADLIVIDPEHPALLERALPDLLSGLIFCADPAAIRHVIVAGEFVIRERVHPRAEALTRSYRACIRRLALRSG